MAITKTSVGTVDKKALEKLYNSFDTCRIRDAINDIDNLCHSFNEPDGLRKDFFRLHDMAMYLFNDDLPPGNDESIWELAEELSSAVFEVREQIERIDEMLDELVELAPDPDEDDIDDSD